MTDDDPPGRATRRSSLLAERETGGAARRRRAGGHGAASGAGCRSSGRGPSRGCRYPPTEVVSADELESIHLASLRVLAEIGMDFLDDDARELLRGGRRARRARHASASASTRRHGRRSAIRTAPVRVHAARPQPGARPPPSAATGRPSGRSASPPNVSDLDRGRRIGNRADYQNLLRLAPDAQQRPLPRRLPGRAVDIHASVRHLTRSYDALTLTDKPIHCLLPRAAAQHRRPRDGPDRARHRRGDARPRAVGVHGRQLAARRSASTRRCSTGIIEFGQRNQVVVHHAVHARRRDGAR